jgi:hypothetical protein
MTRQAMKVCGVDLSKADMKCVDAALAQHGLPVGGTDAQKITRLAQYYKSIDKSKLADCSTCGGISDVTEPTCPYCGDGAFEDSAGESLHQPSLQLKPETSAMIVPSAPDSVQTTSLMQVAQPSVVLPRVWTEADLDEAVRKVHELKLVASERMWELGAAIKHIFDNELWKQRSTDGVPRYKTWGQFCEAELGITHSYSYKLMDVAEYFTREEVKQLGATKLAITMRVPKGELRTRMLKAAQDGASVADLDRLAEAIGKEKRDTGRKGKGGAAAHKPTANKGGRKPEKITVAMLVARIEVPLFKHDAPGKRAKSLADMPVGEERMLNGVKQRFVVTKEPTGDLMLVVERTRER